MLHYPLRRTTDGDGPQGPSKNTTYTFHIPDQGTLISPRTSKVRAHHSEESPNDQNPLPNGSNNPGNTSTSTSENKFSTIGPKTTEYPMAEKTVLTYPNRVTLGDILVRRRDQKKFRLDHLYPEYHI